MTETFAFLACVVLAALTLFQIALILGAPLGKFAWGGQHEVLPKNLRIASTSSLALYAIFAVFILDKAGLINAIESQAAVDIGMWVFTVYFFLGVLMNAISRSKYEQMLMTPIASMLAVLFLFVTLS